MMTDDPQASLRVLLRTLAELSGHVAAGGTIHISALSALEVVARSTAACASVLIARERAGLGAESTGNGDGTPCSIH